MKEFLKTTRYLLSVHATALIFFTLFRVIFFFVLRDASQPADGSLVAQAFLMDLRFDNVMCCYLLIVPLAVLGICHCFRFPKTKLLKGFHVFFCIAYSLSFMASAGDIPYFQQFFKHVNASIWNWFDEPSFVFTMLFQEASYLIFIVLFFAADVVFCLILGKWLRIRLKDVGDAQPESWRPAVATFLLTAMLTALCLLGIRGRIGQKSPVRIGTAYFCNNPFLNQLGLNPMYVLLRTSMDLGKEERNKIRWMDETEAVRNAQEYLGIKNPDAANPIARPVVPDSAENRRNVVVIMMESMASHFVADSALTPFLNQLIKKSTYFSNAYSAGIHTMNGVYSTLFSFPALMNQHPLKSGEIQKYESMPVTLRKLGYSTFYFSTHDEQFDNIGGYLSANDVERIVAEKDYPHKEVRSNLGVCDDFMFRFSLPILEAASADGPFFAAFLTASNHAPYVIPEYYQPRSENPRHQVIEFADFSLRVFFEHARSQPWFSRTIFVLLGDHGASNNDYDVPLSYHHIPLIVYDPARETQEIHTEVAGQIDVYPTVMGMLNLPYTNNTFGIDLLKEKREMLFFSSDDSYCCVDSSFYFVHRMNGGESLYLYGESSKEDHLDENPARADAMRRYAESMIQAAQYLVENKKVSVAE